MKNEVQDYEYIDYIIPACISLIVIIVGKFSNWF